MGTIIFNGLSSQDYHIQVEHPPGYDIPERDYEAIHVPGRNGDIIISKNSYKNVTRTYEISFGSTKKKFPEMARKVSEWLHSATNYARLEDSYEPEFYRLGVYNDSLEMENILFHAGRAEISFNCKPQRFFKIGDKISKFTSQSGNILRGPSCFPALPIVTVYGSGSGTLNINGYVVGISAIDQYVTINSELQDCYKGSLNKNNTVSLGSDFPKLDKEINKISYSGGITSVEVIPKWWTL